MDEYELRQLDGEIHMRVFDHNQWETYEMDLLWNGVDEWHIRQGVLDSTPHYSTSIADAWQVLEHLPHKVKRIQEDVTNDPDYRFEVELSDYSYGITTDMHEGASGAADSLPLAICRAALAALGVARETGV